MSTRTQKAPAPPQSEASQALSVLDDRILALIIGHTPLAKVLEIMCAEIERHYSGMLCSVLLLDADGETLRPGAAPSLPEEYNRAIDGVKIGPSVGSCGTAIYRKQAVVVSDIANDPLWAEFRHHALRQGLRACWSTPIPAQDGSMLGTFAIYYREPRSPDAEHLRLIAHATHLVALAIERDRDKTELRAAEDRYRTLVERLPAITYVAELGADGPWHYVSPQIGSILGFSPEEWLAEPMNWLNHIHSEDREIALAAEKRFIETQELFQAEYRMFARDGRVLWFRDEGVMLQGAADDRRPLMQGVLYDITERKRLEEQLHHSQKLEAVGQLAGGVAHDFNNLLMVIQAHNERLRGRLAAGDPAHKDAEEIERAVTRATKMLHRLIPVSIELKISLNASPDRIKADPGQVEQVLMNLAVNARDAMPQGGQLVIETKNVELYEAQAGEQSRIPRGKYVVLTVSDNGIGMTAELLSRIFEPFFTTKKPGKGTGLGLAIVYGVIKQTGGWITTRSEPGRGTTFDIYFPPATEQDSGPESGAKAGGKSKIAESGLATASTARGTETVLLVEDQDGIRDLVGEFLRKSGYTVLIAADGNEALQMAKEHKGPIDLLLSDVVMPNLGGRELSRRLTEPRPQMKVLFMSGYPDHGTWSSELVDDSASVLQKPFALETLARKIRVLLDN
jgi:two-component system cell cycle sensor histidine kinase/response regulator CckA